MTDSTTAVAASGPASNRPGPAALTELDAYLFREGTHVRLYEKFGAHLGEHDGRRGAWFRVWAPNAASVAVIGEFNVWDPQAAPLAALADGSGVWEGFVADVSAGAVYKYRIVSRHNGFSVDKADPFAFAAEAPPQTASRVWALDYQWGDDDWMGARRSRNALDAPMSIYEVHLGSWRRDPADPKRLLSYREMAAALADYVTEAGFTHVELMPITEHPFYGSWGYQTTGYFAPTARYGTPQDFMHLVDHLHQRGVGVILDWVPSHFPSDEHGLVYFDGTHLYEHADPRQGFHPEWNSYIFNYGRNEVRAFLASSALFWLDRYHIDGLRVDAVASMLYLDYGRRPGEWIPNPQGGRENLEAVHFLRQLNEAVYRDHPDTQTIAEESTAWPMVSRPVSAGGLGFGMKWNMGWMHDTLAYMGRDPLYRRFHHDQLTFGIWYAFTENFVLPFSHDEVVYGKGSLLRRMPGDTWQRFAGLRTLLGYLWAHPGKKLVFMGCEFGQWHEWNHEGGLDWAALADPMHAGVQRWVSDLNRLYRGTPALHQQDFEPAGFEWIEPGDAERSVLAFVRVPRDAHAPRIVAVCNLTPEPRRDYVVGVPRGGAWREALNSDAVAYGGSGLGNQGSVDAQPVPAHGRSHSLRLTVPPLAVIFLESPQ